MLSFASDNHAGVHPHVLKMLTKVNEGFAPAYGGDVWTARARECFRREFGADASVFFTFTGSAANVLGLASVLSSFESVICADTAHLNVDECGAPEAWLGCKLLTVKCPDAKLTVQNISDQINFTDDVHKTQPKVISISQTTEYGTLYSATEIAELARFAHARGLLMHMDGARISNACAALGASLREITGDAGVDLLSLGGTKNGLLAAEAIVSFGPELRRALTYGQKQGLQLASKMRFISAQFLAFFEDELWLENARHANAMTHLLNESLSGIPEFQLTQKPQGNAIFARMPKAAIDQLQKEFLFYVWDTTGNQARPEIRLMTSFQTTPEMVAQLAKRVREVCVLTKG